MIVSVTTSNNVGVVSYLWTINQITGTTVSGVSIGSGSNSVTVTYPNTITYAGDAAVTGDYSFTVQCVSTDAGVPSCNQVRSRTLWFTIAVPSCTLTMTPITVS